MTEAEQIAAKLTEAQRRAVLWLPDDGSWTPCRAHWTVANSVVWIERKLPEIAEAKIVGQNGGANDLRHRLTPLGIQVRTILKEQQP